MACWSDGKYQKETLHLKYSLRGHWSQKDGVFKWYICIYSVFAFIFNTFTDKGFDYTMAQYITVFFIITYSIITCLECFTNTCF